MLSRASMMMTSLETLKSSFALDIKLFDESVSRDIGTEGFVSNDSNPSRVRFIKTGEMMPPCGVPVVARLKDSRSMIPASSHFFRIARSIGMCDNNHSCEISSKQLWMSPSKIHCGDFERASKIKHCSIASATDRSFRKP